MPQLLRLTWGSLTWGKQNRQCLPPTHFSKVTLRASFFIPAGESASLIPARCANSVSAKRPLHGRTSLHSRLFMPSVNGSMRSTVQRTTMLTTSSRSRANWCADYTPPITYELFPTGSIQKNTLVFWGVEKTPLNTGNFKPVDNTKYFPLAGFDLSVARPVRSVLAFAFSDLPTNPPGVQRAIKGVINRALHCRESLHGAQTRSGDAALPNHCGLGRVVRRQPSKLFQDGFDSLRPLHDHPHKGLRPKRRMAAGAGSPAIRSHADEVGQLITQGAPCHSV